MKRFQFSEFPMHLDDMEDPDLIVPDVEPNNNSAIFSTLARKPTAVTASRAIIIPRILQTTTRVQATTSMPVNARQLTSTHSRMSVLNPSIQMTPLPPLPPPIIKLPAGTDIDFINQTSSRGKANQFWQYVCNDCSFITQDSRMYKKHRSLVHEAKSQSTTKASSVSKSLRVAPSRFELL